MQSRAHEGTQAKGPESHNAVLADNWERPRQTNSGSQRQTEQRERKRQKDTHRVKHRDREKEAKKESCPKERQETHTHTRAHIESAWQIQRDTGRGRQEDTTGSTVSGAAIS